jgi:hypothetical protein
VKTSGLVGPFLLVLLVVVFAVSWQRERQRAGILAEECQRLAQEVKLVNSERTSGSVDKLLLVLPVTAESSLSMPPESANGSEVSNHVVTADLIETNTLVRAESVPAITALVSLPSTANEDPPYTDLQLEIYRCANQLGVINFAAERWAADHKAVILSDLMALRGYLAPMTLVCPGIRPKTLSVAWENFTSSDITYQIVPGSKGKLWDFHIPNQGSPATMRWLYCPIHKKLSMENRVDSGGIPGSQVFRPR